MGWFGSRRKGLIALSQDEKTNLRILEMQAFDLRILLNPGAEENGIISSDYARTYLARLNVLEGGRWNVLDYQAKREACRRGLRAIDSRRT